MESSNYWDCVASKKKFTTPFPLELFQEYVGLNETILDVGCGYGRVLKILRNANYSHLIGVDISKKNASPC